MINLADNEIIRSAKNLQIIELSKIGSDKKHRDNAKIFIAEGVKLFSEAVKFNAVIKKVLIYDDFAVNINRDLKLRGIAEDIEISRKRGAEVIFAGKNAFMKVSTEQSPQGIIAVLEYDEKKHRRIKPLCDDDVKKYRINDDELIMAFESVRDPSNLGAMMRSASAFGFNRLILAGGCADIYSTKTLRASMGAVFKLEIDIFDSVFDAAEVIKKSNRRILGAILDESAEIADRNFLKRSDCAVIGNEGHGISGGFLSLCDASIYIPIKKETESLNAASAASIIMWEQSRCD